MEKQNVSLLGADPDLSFFKGRIYFFNLLPASNGYILNRCFVDNWIKFIYLSIFKFQMEVV